MSENRSRPRKVVRKAGPPQEAEIARAESQAPKNDGKSADNNEPKQDRDSGQNQGQGRSGGSNRGGRGGRGGRGSWD